MKESNKINCPSCGEVIDVNAAVYHRLHEQVRTEFSEKLLEQRKKYDVKFAELDEREKRLVEERGELSTRINEAVDEKLKVEREIIEKRIRDQITSEHSDQYQLLQEELNDKSSQLKEFNKVKAQVQRLEREKEEMRDRLMAEAESVFTEKLKKERESIKKAEEERIELKLVEKDDLIKQLSEKLKEAQRKVEQGSIQAQGEAQEIAIEEYLRGSFPLDTIEEVRKGARGADCLQIIHTRGRQNCGSIYYESKRTKNFSSDWIQKFRDDMRDKGANIGVLVTDVMPSEMERLGQKDGIWICTYAEFKGLCFVLRESIIAVSDAIASQENKGDKMAMLYSFLTSNEFRLQIEAIVDGFTQLKDDLEREKRAIKGIWKKREKQIDKVLLNTNFLYNSVKGIAGSAIQPVPALEITGLESASEESI